MHILQKTRALDLFFIPTFFVGWAWLSLFLTWTHTFYALFFILYGCIGAYLAWQWRTHFNIYKKSVFLLFLSFALSCSLAFFFHASSLFTGRDQGSIAQASIMLSEQHTLAYSSPEATTFFNIYGQGTALNFPGFAYTENGKLVTQFPIASIAWYASFYSLFGISGFPVANAVLLFLFFWSLVLLSKTFLNKAMALFLLLLCTTTFPIFWFPRFTLSENFLLGFLWITLAATVQFIQKEKMELFWLAILAGSLLPFARIEGIAFFGILCALFLARKKMYAPLRKQTRPIILFSITFLSLFFWNMSVTLPFYKNIVKALLHSDIVRTFTSQTAAVSENIASGNIAIFAVFFSYGLLNIILLGIVAIILFVWKKRDDFALFVPILITAPAFIYLFHSFISGDHPWMLRRFVFAVIPILLWYSIIFLQKIAQRAGVLNKITAGALLLFLFISNLGVFVYFFPFSEGNDLLNETRELSKIFGDNDLILVDQLTTSDPWLLISGPLSSVFKKHAVYFFNPNDWEKLNTSSFEKTYVIVSEKNAAFYTESSMKTFLKPEDAFTLSFDHLQPETNSFSMPKKQHITEKLFIYSLHP